MGDILDRRLYLELRKAKLPYGAAAVNAARHAYWQSQPNEKSVGDTMRDNGFVHPEALNCGMVGAQLRADLNSGKTSF